MNDIYHNCFTEDLIGFEKGARKTNACVAQKQTPALFDGTEGRTPDRVPTQRSHHSDNGRLETHHLSRSRKYSK